MKGSNRLRLIMAVATALTSCVLPLDVSLEGDDDIVVEGAGEVVTQTWAVGGFHAIHARGVGDVIVTRTDEEALSITGEENIISLWDVEVNGGVLEIGPRPGVHLQPTRKVIIEIDVERVDRIEGSGAVSFVARIGQEETLAVTLTGACALEAEGTVDVLDVDASGVTSFRGHDLRSKLAYLSTSGVAGAVVWAAERLEATASGVSYIRYLGSPDLHVSVSGLATVKPY